MREKEIKNLKIGIIGIGIVGGAVEKYFKKSKKKLFLYDKYKKIGSEKEVNQADVIFICVPTPFDKNNGCDLSYLKDAIKIIRGNKIIVIKSTVVPGTTENFQRMYSRHKFLFNPEFLTHYTADQDMQYPDRQIIGYTKKSYNVAGSILKILPLAPYEKIMPATEAEMVKYFGNTWFSVKVAFANQMYDLCEKLGLDYYRVMEAASADKRIGSTHLDVFHSGYRGYGGKCLYKDMKSLIKFAEELGIDLKLHKVVDRINEQLLKKQGIKDPENPSAFSRTSSRMSARTSPSKER